MGSARDFLEESYGEWTLDFVVGLVLDSDKIASFLARWWKSTKKPWHAEQILGPFKVATWLAHADAPNHHKRGYVHMTSI